MRLLRDLRAHFCDLWKEEVECVPVNIIESAGPFWEHYFKYELDCCNVQAFNTKMRDLGIPLGLVGSVEHVFSSGSSDEDYKSD
jgi:hypothetical protein